MATAYDALIIGTGQAGPALAARLAGAGMKVAVIEKAKFGGTCVNDGCTPTKAMVASAYAAHLARRAGDYGVALDSVPRVDMKRVKARKDAIVEKSAKSVEEWMRGLEGATVYRGHARFTGKTTVRVADEELTADKIFLDVGGRPLVPKLEGLNEVPFLTNQSMMTLDFVPEHLLVVGGSYVGLEFAHMYRRFGAKVTVIEMGPRLIGREDEDVSQAVKEILEAEGIGMRLDAECLSAQKETKGLSIGVGCKEGDPRVWGSHLLLAVGRVPNTDDLGLEAAGIGTDKRGYIEVDEALRTSNSNVWALGDCNGKGAFTHTAYNDYEIVAANLLDGASRRVSDRIMAYALFIDPPLGRVGLTEAQARQAGKRILVGQRPMTRVARAVEKGEAQGFMKLVADADTKQLLGAAILGPGGDEAVHAVLDLMAAKAPYSVMQQAMHIHPTVAELLPTVLGELKPAG
ncbi:MAG TPA: FAD-containing oxidoreductase [Caulobacteraceae bacterium]|nr:FAD-containing oxidoreductase [Caulobacteraceae bacterium]